MAVQKEEVKRIRLVSEVLVLVLVLVLVIDFFVLVFVLYEAVAELDGRRY